MIALALKTLPGAAVVLIMGVVQGLSGHRLSNMSNL